MKRSGAQLSHIQPLRGCETEDDLSPRLRLRFLISRLFEADMEIPKGAVVYLFKVLQQPLLCFGRIIPCKADSCHGRRHFLLLSQMASSTLTIILRHKPQELFL